MKKQLLWVKSNVIKQGRGFRIWAFLFFITVFLSKAASQPVINRIPGHLMNDSATEATVLLSMMSTGIYDHHDFSRPRWRDTKWSKGWHSDITGYRYRRRKAVILITSPENTGCVLVYFWVKRCYNRQLKQWELKGIDEETIIEKRVSCALLQSKE
jgi:hypothetical protein